MSIYHSTPFGAVSQDFRNRRSARLCALYSCIYRLSQALYTELSRLNTEHDTLQSEYAVEKNSSVSLTITEVKFFLSQLKKGRVNDMTYRKTLINVFVNAIYLYDDRLVIIFNSGDKPVTVDDDLLSQINENSGFVFNSLSSTT